MEETFSPDRLKDLLLDARMFKAYVAKLSDREKLELLQALTNEFIGLRLERRRLNRINGRLVARVKTIKTLYEGSMVRSSCKDGFIRYKISMLLDKKMLPKKEPADSVWHVMDQHGRVAKKFRFYFKAGWTVAGQLKDRDDLKLWWSKRHFLSTDHIPTLITLLKEEEQRAPLLCLRAEFPARMVRKKIETVDYSHYFIVRSLHGGAKEIPEIIESWGTYKRQRRSRKKLHADSPVPEDSGQVPFDEDRSCAGRVQ